MLETVAAPVRAKVEPSKVKLASPLIVSDPLAVNTLLSEKLDIELIAPEASSQVTADPEPLDVKTCPLEP